MAVNLVRSTRLFRGAPYAYAAKASGGVLIFTAGACPLDERGHVVALGDVSAQMRQALQNLRIALEESGATIPDVLKTTVYVASSDRRDLVTAWDEVAGFFGDHDVPSTLLGVAVLGYPGQLVEIEAIAVAPSHLAPTEPGPTPSVSDHGMTFDTERRIGASHGWNGIQGPGKVMKLRRDLRFHNCRDVPGVSEGGGRARAERWKLSHSPSSATRDARPIMRSSSLTAAARGQYLLDLLAQLPDPRKRRGRRHWLAGLLAVGIAAVTAGSRSFAVIGRWAADAGPACWPGSERSAGRQGSPRSGARSP